MRGVSAPPPSRRAVQAGQAAQEAYAAGQMQGGGSQWGDAGRSQWGAPAAPARAQLLWLIFDSGQRELIDEPLTIGRRPASVEGTRSVVVPDTTVSLSRTHMRVGPTATGAWIEDAFSANGTQIRTPDGRISALAGRPSLFEVPAGTEILMGDVRRATISFADVGLGALTRCLLEDPVRGLAADRESFFLWGCRSYPAGREWCGG